MYAGIKPIHNLICMVYEVETISTYSIVQVRDDR